MKKGLYRTQKTLFCSINASRAPMNSKKQKANKITEYQLITQLFSIIIAKSVTLCVAIGDNKVAIETGVVATIKLLYTSKLVCVWQMWQ